MKCTLFTLLFFLCSFHSFAQAPTIEWQKSFGGTLAEEAYQIQRTFDSGYIIAGKSQSTDGDLTGNFGESDLWIVKMSATGIIQWQKNYGGSLQDRANWIQQTSDSGYIIVGNTISFDGEVTGFHDNGDIWVVKIDDTGAIQWEKCIGGTSGESPGTVIETHDSCFVIAGNSLSSDGDLTGNHGGADYWIVKLSWSGSIIWQKNYGGARYDVASCILQANDGGYIIAGTTASYDGDVTGYHGTEDYWVVKIDDTGRIQWEKTYGGVGADQANFMIHTFDGGYIIAGGSNSTDGDVTGNHGNFDYWIVKINATGTLEWQKSFGGSSIDFACSIQQTTDSGFIICGAASSSDYDVSGSHGGSDYWMVKISSTGTLQWQKCLGGSFGEVGYFGLQVSDGYVAAGWAASPDGDVTGLHGSTDYWIVKLNCNLHAGSITGPSNVCIGSSITLIDTASGGVWRATNSNATVAAGLVNGISPGVDTIFYTVTNTCGSAFTSLVITVNPLPSPVITATGLTLSTTTPYVTYQWLLGGSIIPGATSSTFTAVTTGSYTVIVSDIYGCSDTSGVYIITTTGLSSLNSLSSLVISPNPTTGIITLSGATNTNIKVYNTIGQLLKESNTNNISITEFPAGLYFVKVFDELGALVKNEKVVKL